jgi:hypothetical protein
VVTSVSGESAAEESRDGVEVISGAGVGMPIGASGVVTEPGCVAQALMTNVTKISVKNNLRFIFNSPAGFHLCMNLDYLMRW